MRILLPIASKWMLIGTLLEVPKDVLTNIRIKEREDPQECLRAMLATLVYSATSWAGLAEAVEPVNPAKAKEIREKYLSIGSVGRCELKSLDYWYCRPRIHQPLTGWGCL